MHDETAKSVADSVRAEMARKRVSARKLAEAIGLDRGVLHRRLDGTVPFRADELVAIARYLQVAPSVFLDFATAEGAATHTTGDAA